MANRKLCIACNHEGTTGTGFCASCDQLRNMFAAAALRRRAGELRSAYDRFNAEYFGGQLARPVILILNPSSPRALGDYSPRDAHGIESRIRIAPRVFDFGMTCALDVLLHEMVHAWAHEIGGDLEDGYRGHGPKFAAVCNDVGGKLGLAPVYARPRGKSKGQPDCAQWPINVRPAGYYGDDDPRKEHAKAPKAPKVDSDPADAERAPVDDAEDDGAIVDASAELLQLRAQVETLRAQVDELQADRDEIAGRYERAGAELRDADARIEQLQRVERAQAAQLSQLKATLDEAMPDAICHRKRMAAQRARRAAAENRRTGF